MSFVARGGSSPLSDTILLNVFECAVAASCDPARPRVDGHTAMPLLRAWKPRRPSSLQRVVPNGLELHPGVPAPGTLSAPRWHLDLVYPGINPS